MPQKLQQQQWVTAAAAHARGAGGGCHAYLAANADAEEHEEEHHRPDLADGEASDGFRVHDEHQTRPCPQYIAHVPIILLSTQSVTK